MNRPPPASTEPELFGISTPNRAKGSIHFSSQSDEWPTPKWLFEALDAEFGFDLDPCSTHENAKCRWHFTKIEDGLRQDWSDASAVFVNPPYGRQIGRWLCKAFNSAQSGTLVACLVPARTDTDWWHRYAMKGEIRLLRRRIKFEGAQHAAPFPSALVIFRPRTYRLLTASISAKDPTPS